MGGILAPRRAGCMQASSTLEGALTRTPWQMATGGPSWTETPTSGPGCPQRGVRSPKQTACPLQGQPAVRVLAAAGGQCAAAALPLDLWLGVAQVNTVALGSTSRRIRVAVACCTSLHSTTAASRSTAGAGKCTGQAAGHAYCSSCRASLLPKLQGNRTGQAAGHACTAWATCCMACAASAPPGKRASASGNQSVMWPRVCPGVSNTCMVCFPNSQVSPSCRQHGSQHRHWPHQPGPAESCRLGTAGLDLPHMMWDHGLPLRWRQQKLLGEAGVQTQADCCSCWAGGDAP